MHLHPYKICYTIGNEKLANKTTKYIFVDEIFRECAVAPILTACSSRWQWSPDIRNHPAARLSTAETESSKLQSTLGHTLSHQGARYSGSVAAGFDLIGPLDLS